MDAELLAWRLSLLSLALGNLLLLAWTATRLRPWLQGADAGLRRRLLLLAAGYTLGCAWRSVFPVFDVPRLVMLDAWPSSILLGRSVATAAELCFAAQWALLLQHLGDASGCNTSLRVARLLLPLIALAEICSWQAVLSTSNLGHVLEETLWAVAAGAVLLALLALRPRLVLQARPALGLSALLALGYLLYLLAVDVPGYWARWQAELSSGHQALGLLDGLHDAATRRQLALRWSDWRGEVLWMSLYFSVGVWVSLALASMPVSRLMAAPVARAVPGKLRPTARSVGATR